MSFELGSILFTRGVNEEVRRNNDFAAFITESFKRYVKGDWGDLCKEDKALNDSAVKNNDDRIVARYNDIYIITEYDRSATTILFTHEY